MLRVSSSRANAKWETESGGHTRHETEKQNFGVAEGKIPKKSVSDNAEPALQFERVVSTDGPAIVESVQSLHLTVQSAWLRNRHLSSQPTAPQHGD